MVIAYITIKTHHENICEGNWAHRVIEAVKIANMKQIVRPIGIDHRRYLYGLAVMKWTGRGWEVLRVF